MVRKMTQKQKDAMARGRRRKARLQKQRSENNAKAGELQARYNILKALYENGTLFIIKPADQEKVAQYISYADHPNVPEYLKDLKPDVKYYVISDYAAGDMPINQQAGWRKFFTKEEAEMFVKKHTGPLMRLKGKRLRNYCKNNGGDGGIRLVVFSSPFSNPDLWQKKVDELEGYLIRKGIL